MPSLLERVGNVMRREFATASPSDMLESVFVKLKGCNCHSIPIVRDTEPVGIVTMENVGEFLAIQGALRTTHGVTNN